MMKQMKLMAALAVMLVGSALVANATVVFEADFQGSAAGASNLLNATVVDRNAILDNGTSVGSWDDNDSSVNMLYEIAADETTNKVMVFSSVDNTPNVADADFSSSVSLAGNELVVGWDWMHTDEGGGGSGQAIIQLLDAADAVVTAVVWQDGGALTVDGVNLGVFKRELLGTPSTVLSTNNWNPLAMELVMAADGLQVSVGGTVQTNLAGTFNEVAALRFKSLSNRSYSQGGMWIDNIQVESVPAASASVVLDPSTQLNISLDAPNSTAVETVDASFFYGPGSNDVDITSVSFSALSHGAGSFACTNGFPVSLTSPSPAFESLGIQFDNAVAGLSHAETATGTIDVHWTEIGSGVTNSTALSVAATYNDTPATFVFGQTTVSLVAAAPNTAATGTVTVAYTESTALKTNVVITGISFTNTTASVFSGASTNLPLTIMNPSPETDTISIAFDVSGMVSGDTATGNVVVTWNEVGDATQYQSLLPIHAAYYDLTPGSGAIANKGTTFPTNNIVFESRPPLGNKGITVRRHGVYDASGYSKVGQEIKGSALSAGNSEFDSIYLKMRQGQSFENASGANQLQMWFGKINETTGGTNETLAIETFDCVGKSFTKNRYYQFSFSDAVDFEPTNLASNEAYAIQLWFTTDDPDNVIQFWCGATNIIAGGLHEEVDVTSMDAAFPMSMSSNRVENADLHFALANSAGTSIPDIGNISVEIDGTNIVMGWTGEAGTDYLMLKTDDLVEGLWTTNVIPGEDGQMSVTNDTAAPKLFYRVIVE
ncbi:hypothetical protein PDESU_04906 [Pontiella desulfatans]|uniref:Uncharacterized protein n=2 Tax=Pontiella desulfatans TaxID=2750659 RepID=A0A6C2U8N0_PONDE|nr:hypothetical protein PDESU_04906 [Pontiella desulfatans]